MGHVRDRWGRTEECQDVVDLLLTLGDDELRVAVVDHVGDLRERGALVDPHRGAAGRLRSQLGDQPRGPVVADDRHLASGLEPERHQAEGEIAHPLAVAPPARLPPDAEFLFAQRGALAEPLFVLQEELGKRVQGAHAACPSRYAACTSALLWTYSG